MINATFKFDLDDHIMTPFNSEGIITMCGVDGDGIQYYVKTATGGNWFKERELSFLKQDKKEMK